jgi:uncharacterized protein YfaS (alpha-2-macroglobulin family)
MITRLSRVPSCLVVIVVFAVLAATSLRVTAQDIDQTPSFTLASSQIFNTREQPAIGLYYRQVDHLDFRVYRVNDAFAFFEKLEDPHQLGSEEPVVPQERTFIERIALWKAGRRADFRRFVRRQFSPEYREARRNAEDAREVVQRQTLNVNTFAQVPLLNPSQLVTSWREVLPPVRDAEYRRVPLDLESAGIFVVEAVNPPLRAYTVVVVSDVGLVTKTAPGQMLVFAANRFSGDPLSGCRVRVLADTRPIADGTTAADGTFEAEIQATNPDDLVTIAQCGREAAATDPGAYTVRQPVRDLVGYIYTDRPVYRPGHTVRFKGVLRWREKGALAPFEREPVEISIVDANEKVLLRERKTPDEFGSVAGSFPVAATAALGYYTVRIARGEDSASGSFEVQEYRKPEFDVAVRPAAKFVIQGSEVKATIAARYYFGQPVAGGSVKYVVHTHPYYSPLRFENAGGEDEGGEPFDTYGGDEQLQGTALLDGQGLAEVSIPLELDEHQRDYTARIEARVTDASGREVAGASSINATYGRFMVIARLERYVHAPGETATVNLRAIDYDGAPQPGTRMRLALERIDYRRGSPSPSITTIQQNDVEAGPDGRATSTLTVPAVPASYRVRVTAPADGREVADIAYLWVSGRAAEYSREADRFLEIVADRRTYAPGETARIIVRGAEFDAQALVTKENQRVSYHQVVRARTNEAIEVPIAGNDVGDTYVSIAFLKDDQLYRAERRLSVPATAHQLTVTAEADRPVIRPGEPGVFTLRVADATGAPVRAQLSVGLVDEALYGVRPDTTPDPLRFFYRREYSMVGTSFSRNYSFVGYSGTDELQLARRRRRPLTLADFKADRPDRPRVRKDFPDTVFWASDVTTSAEGTAVVKIDYPDSLTSWRLTVRAVTTGTDVGKTTTNTTTTKDLILRVVTPRFLTEGDQVSIPTIVHNYLTDSKTVAVSFSAEGLTAADPAPSAPRSMQVASSGEQRVDWRFKAESARSVTVTGKATTDVAGDAMELTLPVLPAGLQRNTGSAGSILDAAERRIELTVPPAANVSGRSVRVALAPSLAGTMLGALDYLASYPWGCTEQTLSSFVPNIVVLRALEQLKLAPAERLQALDRQVDDGLKRLYDFQHEDGGWGWWKTDENHPFMTAYALDGLLQARENGVNVQAFRVENARRALKALYDEYPRAVPDLKAYEVYVLARSAPRGESPSDDGLDVAAALNELWTARSRMTTSGRALLLLTLDLRRDARGNDLARELVDGVTTKGDLSWWPVDSDPLLEDIVDTSVEASALALQALAARDPRSPMLERVARWLVLNRTGGYWFSTKQTALALRGLLAYMRARGEQAAPVTADVFVNGTRAGTHVFDAQSLTAPNPVLIESAAAEGSNDVRIVRRGAGALYYDASVRYYDKPAASERTGTRRLALLRSYSTLSPVESRGRIVYRESPFNGTARVGDLLVVRLTAAGSSDWRYLMLEDPIPAGTEPIENEELYELEQPRTWWYGSNREVRDDRVVFFLSGFEQSRYEFTYLLKVTTPGVFGAMPARISPMYVPDTSASSSVITLTVPSEGVQ